MVHQDDDNSCDVQPEFVLLNCFLYDQGNSYSASFSVPKKPNKYQ